MTPPYPIVPQLTPPLPLPCPSLPLLPPFPPSPCQFLVYPPAWLSSLSAGLSAAAVALVAEAALSLGAKLCRKRITQLLATAAAVITVYNKSEWLIPTIIVAGVCE